MQLEACLICDAASDYHGKLCVLGAFDTLSAPQAPTHHPHCAVVVRMRFERSEEGQHRFWLLLIDEDGRPHGPKIEGKSDIRVPPDRESMVANMILNINGLPLPRFGTYHFDLVVDGDLKARLPLHLLQVFPPGGPPVAR
jgi:hypothetical protein